MAERDGFGEVFVEVEGARDCAGDLADFEGVSEAGYIVVAEWCDEDLRFVFESTERFAVYDAVAVALILGANFGGSLRDGSSGWNGWTWLRRVTDVPRALRGGCECRLACLTLSTMCRFG